MQTPLHLTGSIRSKTRLTQWAHFAIFIALASLLYFEAHLFLKAPAEGALSSHSTSSALQARLNEVSSGITSYLDKHDPASLEQIKGEGKEASRILVELQEHLRQQGDVEESARIEQAHAGLRESTVQLLAADQDTVKARQGLNDANEALASVLEQMQSAIRSNQLNSSGRTRALRVAAAEAKNSSKDPSRFIRAVSTYQSLSRTRRAERWTDEARTHFEESIQRGNAVEQAEQKKKAALDRFVNKRKVLEKTVKDTPLGASEGRTGLAFVVVNGILVLAGLVLVVFSYGRTDRDIAGPIQNILQCVEAASAGDTSRLPDYWSADEVGQLSQATGRLITVLARSENLIYHLAALVESSGDAIISQTLDGKILSWNKGAQRIYGYSAEEVKGQSIAILSPGDEGAGMINNLRKIRAGERLQPFETLHQARNGRTVRAFVRVAAIHDSTRKIIGASFVAQDLSDTHLLQSKAAERNQTV